MNKVLLAILLVPVLLVPVLIINQAYAQDPQSLEKDFADDPARFFGPDGRGTAFLFFLVGIALYTLFVWYFGIP